jgi:Zn-dependent protease
MLQTLAGFALLFPLFIIAVIIHEVSHGVVALCFGDTTAKQAGRLTLNPLKHIDPLGTVILPGLLMMMSSPVVLGWAKPVPVNPLFMRHPKQDMLWVGVAGPASNFLMAAIAAAVLRVFGLTGVPAAMAAYFVVINIVLGVFNMFPIPPLDGSRVLTSLLPPNLAKGMLSLERWGFAILIALLYFGVIDRVMMPIVERFARLLLGASG